jgi:hypothetical protein
MNAYPNPFDKSFTLTFTLAKAGNVGVQVFDALGKTVDEVKDRVYPEGSHSIRFENTFKSVGFYYVRVNVDGRVYLVKQVRE